MRNVFILSIFLAAILAACGGGSSSLPVAVASPAATAPSSPAKTTGSATFAIFIPSASVMKKARPNYVSPNTQYAGITVTEVAGSPVPSPTPLVVSLTSSSPNCSASSSGTTCSITATYPVGADAWTIALYGANGVTSTPLSINSVAQTLVAGQNSVNLTMNPVAASLAFSPSSGTCQSNNSTCVQPATLEVLDATNAVIVGPGNYVNASGAPVTIVVSPVPAGVTLETSSGYPAATSATGPAQMNLAQIAYNGTGATGSLQIGASITAGDPASYTLNLTTPSPAPTSTASPTAAPSSGPTATLPPMGVYNSCEIDTALPSCESQDSAIVQEGFQWEINQIGIAANATGANSLQSWFQYDASIGLGQVFFINKAINDPTNVLTGNILITDFDASLSNTCPGHPTNNKGIIQCIYNIASSVPGFKFEWYLYDEPGCPSTTTGYCAGTLAGGNYQNVQTLAQYIESIDPTHAVRGVNVGGGCGSGCYIASNAATEAATIANLYSCNNQSPCSAWSSPYTNNWLSSSYTPNTGFDYFPIPENVTNALIGDIGYIAGDVANTTAATYPSETISYTVQAFSWMQEGWTSQCSSSYTVCPFPTEVQMQEMRDEALYYANAAGHPMSRIYWYDWPDLSCETAYSGCNSSANLAAVKSAMTAPFPATAPARNI